MEACRYTAALLLADLESNGVHLEISGGNIAVRAKDGAVTNEIRDRLRASKLEILQLLKTRQNGCQAYVKSGEVSPLSFGQQRMWISSQVKSGSIAYNLTAANVLEGGLDAKALKSAFKKLVERHESLRTTFKLIAGEPVQCIQSEMDLPIEEVDVQGKTDPYISAQKLAAEDQLQAFDLERGPLIRGKLIRIGRQRWMFVLTLHHIIGDGWSVMALVREVSHLYVTDQSSEAALLPVLLIHYRDYAIYQNDQFVTGRMEESKQYWHRKLGGELPTLELPSDHRRPSLMNYRGAALQFKLTGSDLKKLKELGRIQEASLFMVLVTLVKILLYRYTGQQDIIVGTATANREHKILSNQIGFYVETLALRDLLTAEEGFIALLLRVKQTLLDAIKHRKFPFDKLVEELGATRDLSRHPIFDVMVVMNEEWAQPALAGIKIIPVPMEQVTTNFDLTFEFSDKQKWLEILITYNLDIYDTSRIDRLGQHLQELIKSVLKDPTANIGEVDILPAWEKHKLLVEFNKTATDYPKDKTIHALFEEQVKKTPDNVAVVFEDQKLTYAELNMRANQLARHLRRKGVKPDQLVAIMVERSLEMVIAVLGVLKAGGAYVPLDPKYPKERLAVMLADAQVKVMLTQEKLLEQLPEHTAEAVCLNKERDTIDGESGLNLHNQISSQNLAYVIYTSGSTGRPKGVALQHCGLCNAITSSIRIFGIHNKNRVLQFAAFSFDVSVWDIFCALLSGSSLHLLPADFYLSEENLIHELRSQRITLAFLLPSILLQLPSEGLPELQTIVTGGDFFPEELVMRWAPGRSFYYAYGPTEATILQAFTECRVAVKTATIGRPISNTCLYILDNNLKLAPIGVVGELYIAGEGLARGYLSQPELTGEKFIPNPFSEMAGARLYRSGDMGRYMPDGNIEFMGRVDHQVKVRGFRIELGEIEAVLNGHPSVGQAVVVAREDGGGEKRLVGYVVAKAEAVVSIEELRNYLKGKLPGYMEPSLLMQLEKLPLTPNGKVDRKALPQPNSFGNDRKYQAPRNELEAKLAEIWQEVLGLKKVGINDNFFEIGGQSIKVIRLASKIHKELAVDINIKTIFNSPTIAALSKDIDIQLSEAFLSMSPPDN